MTGPPREPAGGSKGGRWASRRREENSAGLGDREAAPGSKRVELEYLLSQIDEQVRNAAISISVGDEVFFSESNNGKAYRALGTTTILNLATIAERLPQSFKDCHPEVDWGGLRATRNMIGHEYDGVNYFIIWDALETHIPQMGQHILGPRDGLPRSSEPIN